MNAVQGGSVRRWLKWIGAGVLSLVLVLSVVVFFAATQVKLPGEEMTPAGIRRSTSRYVKMRDGVAIAVSVYLPLDLRSDERVPVLMRTTRYWREPQIGRVLRILVALHLVRPDELVDKQVAYFNQRRFAVLLVDARGSGASGGSRVIEYSPAEVMDMGEVAGWAAQQPWSNARVGTFGISYEGNTAELAAIPKQPAIRAVMPLYGTFDNWENIGAGGVAHESFLHEWSNIIAALDRNDVCGANEVQGWNCWKTLLMTPGVRPVDEDSDGNELAELVAQHRNLNVGEAIRNVEFRDDHVATHEGLVTLADISPSGLRERIEASKVPMMVWCGWLDGNPEGALIRFRTFSNPQSLVIGPLSHGGDFNVDPFAATHAPPEPPSEEQFRIEADFFDRMLRNNVVEAVDPSIQYYTMGEERWHTTKIWPPPGFSTERLYFREQNTLSLTAPSTAGTSDAYRVDFTASTGQQTRWHTGLGGGDVVYPDRAAEDNKLLTYTSGPLESDLEITGSPVMTIEMSSTSSDGALHAYLEDVAPDGRVTYLDEGILRLIDRKEVEPKTLPYEPLGPAHSFLRKDAEPLNAGEPARIRLSLFPTSVLLRKGHRIRIALAGADAGFFQRYPSTGTPTWTVRREAKRESFIDLPTKSSYESPFDGTWKIDLSSAQFSKQPEVYLLQNGMWRCETCVPIENIKVDDRDYKSPSDDPCFETLRVKVVDGRTVEGANKKNGKITHTWRATVSADGNSLRFENTYTCNSKSQPIVTSEEYTRVAKGPTGSHAISGSWRAAKASASENDLVETWKVEGDRVSYSDATGQSFVARLDGTYTAVKGDPSHALVSLKFASNNTLVETVKLKGKITSISRMTVAPDGRTMTIVISDPPRGTTDQVVAEKQ